MLKRIFLLVLIFAMVLGCFAACGKKSDEELIERRIGSFVKAYNAGDLDKVIENLSYSERTEMQSYIKLIEGIGFSYSGVSGKLDMSAIFGIAMGSTTDGDMMQINIEAINITDGDKAEVDVSVKMKNKYIEETQSGRIDMVKEDEEWFIKDMNTWKSTEGSSSSKQTTGNKGNATTAGNGKATLAPFDGLQYTITGISPYCEIAVNNQNCSADVQRYVNFSFDKEHYANGDTVVVTAALRYGAGDYTLSKTRHEFKLSGQPEYITSLSGVDVTGIEDELRDYIDAQVAAAIGDWGLFDIHGAGNSYSVYKSVENPNLEGIYFASLKKIKEDEDMDFYNSLNYIYSVFATMEGGSIGTSENVRVYVNISAYNIVKYPDGRVKWGLDDPNAYDFHHKAGVKGVEELVTTTVTVLSSNYNISTIQ